MVEETKDIPLKSGKHILQPRNFDRKKIRPNYCYLEQGQLFHLKERKREKALLIKNVSDHSFYEIRKLL